MSNCSGSGLIAVKLSQYFTSLATVLYILSESSAAQLPAGWTPSVSNPRKAFWMPEESATYAAAIETCNAEGGRLATLDDDRELQQVGEMGELPSYIYIESALRLVKG